MPGDTIINVPGPAGAYPYIIQLLAKPQEWTEPGVYAPAIPGIVVALLGLWIAHKLSVRRDRRKEILELCEGVKGAVGEAEKACTLAWLAPAGPDRLSAIHESKSKLQMLGIMATDLHRRTTRGFVFRVFNLFADIVMSVNVIGEVARFRDMATSDPFEDPDRPSDDSHISDIAAMAAEIHARVNQQFNSLYR